jgi:hypothetical protein
MIKICPLCKTQIETHTELEPSEIAPFRHGEFTLDNKQCCVVTTCEINHGLGKCVKGCRLETWLRSL